jgi:sigma-B regulation protein RsbU (phosphoserine phosphatase)
MKLRWKHFLVLLAASLVPLLAVTWITHNASRRLGKTISGRARNTLMDTVRQEMVRTTRSYATLSHLGGFASEQCIQWLAARAELALALPPLPKTRLYYAADFDDPQSAPKDMALSKNHPIQFRGGVVSYKHISREHPNFLLAPGTNKADVAKDIARFTRLISALKSLGRRYGEGLIWVYASLENGVHISYPGHGGYPIGYDPRKRHWYEMAKKSNAPTWHPMLDATTHQLTLTVSVPFRRPDGSMAGVAGMDIKIAHALVESETTSRWSQKMSSFIVGQETNSGLNKGRIWVISSRKKSGPPDSKRGGEIFDCESVFRDCRTQIGDHDLARRSWADVCGIFEKPDGHHWSRRHAGLNLSGYRGLFHLPHQHRPYTDHHRRLETAGEGRLFGKTQSDYER